MSKKPDDLRVKGKVSPEGAEGEISISNMSRLLYFIAPQRAADADLLAATTQRLMNKISSGEPLDQQDLTLSIGFGAIRDAEKLKNLSAVFTAAVSLLPSPSTLLLPSEIGDNTLTPVSEGDRDWRNRFAEEAANVSDPAMQRYWSALLAQKLSSSDSSSSIGTLSVLRDLDAEVARYFEHVAVRAASITADVGKGRESALVVLRVDKAYCDSIEIGLGSLKRLEEARLVHTLAGSGVRIPLGGSIRYGSRVYRPHSADVENLEPLCMLSSAGKDILRATRQKAIDNVFASYLEKMLSTQCEGATIEPGVALSDLKWESLIPKSSESPPMQ